MICAVNCAALSVALERLKKTVAANEEAGIRTVIFCEDRLSLAAERTVCGAVEGTFSTSVYTFARFLSSECGKPKNVLSAQGSAMAVRRIIEENKASLTLFRKLSAPAAAQTVYDTIALLFSSRVTADDVKKAAIKGGLLGGKLHDLAIIYEKYMQYLEDCGMQDRNGYLRRLAPVIEKSDKIKGAAVIFLGFQAFTCTVTECARAAFISAKDVYGLFIGGKEDIYVNEAFKAFSDAAKAFGGAKQITDEGNLLTEAEILRQRLFNPESFYSEPIKTGRVHVFEAADGEEELEFIAASIKRHVADLGERYAKISVMLPDLESNEGELARVFQKFRIPYYADRRFSLAEHPLTAFIFDFLSCVLAGCRPQDADAAVASPFFPAERADKDVFRNYALRLANWRGGVRKEPKEEALKNAGFDISAVNRVREVFLRGLKIFEKKDGKNIFAKISELLEDFGAADKLKELSESFKDSYPVAAEFGARAYDGVLSVLNEAEKLSAGLSLKDAVKILKSGFAAAEISLIPPKADAVFVGDIVSTVNTGSNVVFAARLTGDVPGVSLDDSLLTDREISLLESSDINISPKIRQVNARKRETAAMNVCAFRERLYLTYPARLNGEECAVSEIISYAKAAFLSPSGMPLSVLNLKRIEKTGRALPYYASEKLPALKQLIKLSDYPDRASAVYETLKTHGFEREADAALSGRSSRGLTLGKQLFLNFGSISPTALETYFSCPYLAFMRQGLKVQEREEGAVGVLDAGNFIHAVLQELAPEVNGISDRESFKARAAELAANKLSKPPYSSLTDVKRGQYTAKDLKEEAVKVAEGMFEQLKNSRFSVSSAEGRCEINLTPEIKIYGRIDRVDEYGDMVRVIDYKTGYIDCSPQKYYTGVKLQLPLYLLSAAEGKRAVGAYYFPAAVEYRDKPDGVFRLQGYMDGSDEVVSASDVTLVPKRKSEYFDASLGGSKSDKVMDRERFLNFLDYSRLVARQGAEELIGGNIIPSPVENECENCKMGGSCGFAPQKNGAVRSAPAVKCADIAEIARGGGKKDA